MKDFFNKLVFVMISIFIIFITLVFLFKSPIKFSENENRYLAVFPKITINNLISGKLTSGIEDYINDHFPWRDFFVGIKTRVETLLGKTKINGIYIAEDDYLIPSFEKTNDEQKLKETLNGFASSVSSVVDLMLVPNSIQIYNDKLPINNEKYDGINEIEKIYDSFKGNVINVHETLLQNKNNYELYYHTDHHWTFYGSFYAYNEYRLKNSLDTRSLKDYNINLVNDSFYGTSYSKANYYNIEPDKIYLHSDDTEYLVHYVVEDIYSDSLYNLEYLDKKDKYSIFLDNNHSLIEIDNLNNNTGEDLLLIKNSYGNSFAPFVVSDYDTISIIDLRYYKDVVSSYVESKKIENILILYDINGIYTDPSIFKLR